VGSTERVIRALGSAEFGRRQARGFTGNCIYYTNQYVQDRQNGALWLFALIADLARFQQDAEHHARRNGLAAEDWGFTLLGGEVLRALGLAGVNELLAQQQLQ